LKPWLRYEFRHALSGTDGLFVCNFARTEQHKALVPREWIITVKGVADSVRIEVKV
jgi:hypothetical protein